MSVATNGVPGGGGGRPREQYPSVPDSSTDQISDRRRGRNPTAVDPAFVFAVIQLLSCGSNTELAHSGRTGQDGKAHPRSKQHM